jgi:hypothetical protein
MTNKQLSPAAQTVLKAVQATLPDYTLTDSTAGCFAAAALRAAADASGCTGWLALTVLHHLHSIADELEAK